MLLLSFLKPALLWYDCGYCRRFVHYTLFPNHNEPVKIAELYLTEVFLVFPGQSNAHGIRHDVDCSLVIVPGLSVGLLGDKNNINEKTNKNTKVTCNINIYNISWYLVHNLVVGSGQYQIHGVHVLGELVVAGMMTVSGLTEDIACCLCFLNIQ